MRAWLLLLCLACVAFTAQADSYKPVRAVVQMCAACQARRWPELRRFIKDAVQGGEYGQQLSIEYARTDKAVLVVYGPYDHVVGRFTLTEQPTEKLHELVQNFGFTKVPAVTSTNKVTSTYHAFASDISDPTALYGSALNSAGAYSNSAYNAYGAYGAYGYNAADPNSILAAGGYMAGTAAPGSAFGSTIGALNTGNIGAVSPGSAFNTLAGSNTAAGSNLAAYGTYNTGVITGTAAGAGQNLGAYGTYATGMPAGTAAGAAAGVPATPATNNLASSSATAGAPPTAAAPAVTGGSGGSGSAAAGSVGAGAAAGGLTGLGSLSGGLGAFGGGLGPAASTFVGSSSSSSSSFLGGSAAAEEKLRPYPISFSGFGRRRQQ